MEYAGNLPDSEVFSRPESFGCGRDAVNRKATGTAYSVYSTSRPPAFGMNTGASGFKSQYGAKTMTTFNTPTTPKTGTTPAGNFPRYSTPATVHLDRLALIQRADNALSMARWHLRKQSTPEVIRQATGKAVAAARALKQVCAESNTQGRA